MSNLMEVMDMAEEEKLPPDMNCIYTPDQSGDSRFMWNRNIRDEVESARKHFESLIAKGYAAFKAIGEEGTKGSQVHKFDESLERVIMTPPMKGG